MSFCVSLCGGSNHYCSCISTSKFSSCFKNYHLNMLDLRGKFELVGECSQIAILASIYIMLVGHFSSDLIRSVLLLIISKLEAPLHVFLFISKFRMFMLLSTYCYECFHPINIINLSARNLITVPALPVPPFPLLFPPLPSTPPPSPICL